MADVCGDNRFQVIERFKKKLIEATNIETSPKEMEVIDDILFRFWQMDWLEKIDSYTPKPTAWHDTSKELPDESKDDKILVLHEDGSYHLVWYSDLLFWNDELSFHPTNVTAWCYLEDILKRL